MKNILLITAELPYPKHKSGTATTLYNLVNEWAKKSQIRILYYGTESIEAEIYYKNKGVTCEFINLKKKYRSDRISAFISIFKLKPRNCVEFDYSQLENIFINEYDSVILVGFTSVFFLEKLAKNKNTSITFFEIDCLSLLYKRFYESTKNYIEKLYYFSQFILVKKIEKYYYQQVERIVFVSEMDKKHCIEEFPDVSKMKFVNIKNGVELFLHEQKVIKRHDLSYNIGFSGIMNYKPNNDAANFIAIHILKEFLERKKNIVFHLIGKNPSLELIEIAKQYPENLVVTGFLEDIDGYISKMDIYISPLFTGTGMKNKILQAMNLGVPIVCTSVSKEGINELEDGKNCVICDSHVPKDWIENILELLKDEKRRLEFGEKNRLIIEDSYTWDNIAEDLLQKI